MHDLGDMRRGEIWVANLSSRRGPEPGKTRPVLLVQADALIEAGHPTTFVVPLTTNLADDDVLRVRVPAQGKLRHDSDLLIDQLRALDTRRLVRGPLATLSSEVMDRVGAAICDVLDIVEPVSG